MTESADVETNAIGQIATIMEGLKEEQRGRVLRYISERFDIPALPKIPKRLVMGTDQETELGAPGEYPDFASLVDACNPENDPMRALVAGYWLQACKGEQSFDAQSANTELKHLGHAIGNVTSALGSLINQKPALALQLRKSGSTKQARKLYKLTEAGIRHVKSMISGRGPNE